MSTKHNIYIIFLLTSLLLSGCGEIDESLNTTQNNENLKFKKEETTRPKFTTGLVRILTSNKDEIDIDVEVADTSEERAYGLMHKKELGEKEGMWFIFDSMEYRTFWMKDTLIPLDMIFIDNENKVVDIIENATPCKEERCEFYGKEIKNQYVLEVNAGFVKDKNISLGDEIYPLLLEQ